MASSSRTLTRVTFGVIIIFVLAQVLWWIIFQQRYVAKVTANTLQSWTADAELIGDMAHTLPEAQLNALLQAKPHLSVGDEGVMVNPERVWAFTAEQEGHLRMFKTEGPVFVLMVLLGLGIIARSLQHERELHRQQQNFLGAITHEFKTPLATLKLLIQTAERRGPNITQQHYLQQMHKELMRLETTTSQVLAAARLEQGVGAAVLEPYNLTQITKHILEELRPSLKARGAQIAFKAPETVLPVSLNPAAFRMVLSNLLDNALKYTPQTPKPIDITLEDTHYTVRLHITDKGIGISPREAQRIFDKFYRAGNEMTRESKGVGLGLYLVKSMVEAMNGWVNCESLDEGTRFTITLPKRVDEA